MAASTISALSAASTLGGTEVLPGVQSAATKKITVAQITDRVRVLIAADAQSQTALTDSTGGTPSTTLAAITAGAAYDQADLTAIKNAIASLAAELALIKTDIANIKAL